MWQFDSINNDKPMNEWLNNVNEEFMERFLRQRIERLEGNFNALLDAVGVSEGPEPYHMNRNIHFEGSSQHVTNASQYQLRCRLELAEQRFDRLKKSFENLESDAMSAAMKRMTDYWNAARAS